MKLHNLVTLLLIVVPLSLVGATIPRVTKPNGSTNWVTGDTVTATTLNGDFNAIFNEFNGSISDVNIAGSAAIGWAKLVTALMVADASVSLTAGIELSKLDGFSDTEAELETTFVAGVATLPSTAAAEIEALRLAVQKLNGATTQTASATQDMEWYMNPALHTNMLYNGDFEDSIDGTITTAPSGWTFTDATGTYTTPDTDTSEGRGHSFTAKIDADGNDDGLTQSLVGLKASTYYLGVVRVKASNSGRCQMITTGGTTNLNATTLSSTYVTLVDVLQVTNISGTIAFALTTDDDSAGTDQCDFDHAALYEMNGDEVPYPTYLPVYTEANGGGAVDSPDYLTNLLTASVTVPGTGYVIKVAADVCAISGSTTRAVLRSRIMEAANGGAAAEVIERQGGGAVSAGVMDAQYSLHLEYFKPTSAITPGASYQYTLQASDDGSGGMTFLQAGDLDCGTIDQQLLVELVKVQ